MATGAIAVSACGGSDDEPEPATEATTPADDRPTGGDPARVGDGAGGVALEQIGSFDQPVYVTDAEAGPGRDLYVVEQCGRIQRVPEGGGEPEVFLDIADQVTCGGEQGLLSVAFAPEGAKGEPGRFYVYFTDTEGTARIVEYRRSADDPLTADPESAREVLSIEDFAPNHNGGLLVFGPDGRLYAGTGDGGGGGDPERTAQDPNSMLGKLLAIEPATDRIAIEALGLRNPWRYSFDSRNGNLWIGDVGQSELEEIDALAADEVGAGNPANFGWSAFEGTQRFNEDQEAPGAIAPVLEYGRDRGCSVTGGYVVRDPELETLQGRYLYGDFCEGQLRSFTADPEGDAGDDRPLGLEVASLSSFGVDSDANVYAVSLEGPVYRLVAEGDDG
jgi:glucose/arabinose dehydrogenase